MSAKGIGQQIINGTCGLDNKPPTAYEELKAWCEKHLTPDEYIASNSRIISINSTDFYFDADGSLNFIDQRQAR